MRRARLDDGTRQRANVINTIIDNLACGEVTLTPGATATTLEDVTTEAIGTGWQVLLQPKTASAASALSTLHAQAGRGSIVISHDASAAVDRTYSWFAITK